MMSSTMKNMTWVTLAALGGIMGQSFAQNGALWHTGGKIAADGTMLVSQDMGRSLDVNPLTGECWSVDMFRDADDWDYTYSVFSKWDEDGILQDSIVIDESYDVDVDPVRNVIWMLDDDDMSIETYNADLTHRFSAWNGSYGIEDIEVNPVDGSAWIACYINGGDNLQQLDANGNLLQTIPVSENIADIDIRPAEGSCWAALWTGYYSSNPNLGEVVKFLADGTEAFRIGLDVRLSGICVDPVDASCWVTTYDREIIKFDAKGNELFRTGSDVRGYIVDPADGSLWGNSYANGHIVKFASDGTLLFESEAQGRPEAVDTGKLYLGYSAIEHANSDTRLWADAGVIDLKANSRKGERAQWCITQLGNGYAQIENRNTGELLKGTNNGEVTMTSEAGNKTQWEIIDAGNGEVMLKNKRLGTLLTGSGGNGLSLRSVTDPGPNYRWVLTDHQ